MKDFDIEKEEHTVDEEQEDNKKTKKILFGLITVGATTAEFISWVMVLVISAGIAFFINNVVIINANVPSGSMENTIMTDDRMIGTRTSYWFSDPERGEVIIFKDPLKGENFVKRVIGLPGEKVVIKDAKIYINDSETPLKEDYLPEEWVKDNGQEVALEYNVPEDSYFVLGDNRNVSNDNRFWRDQKTGEILYVTRDSIIAKAQFVYWPWSNKTWIETADYEQ